MKAAIPLLHAAKSLRVTAGAVRTVTPRQVAHYREQLIISSQRKYQGHLDHLDRMAEQGSSRLLSEGEVRSGEEGHSQMAEKMVEKQERGKRGGGKAGGGGGRGGQSREMQISKALSRLLRHQAENAGINLDDAGFAPLDKVLGWGPLKSLKPTVEEIKAEVKNSDKQRFSIKPNFVTNPSLEETSTAPEDWLIRANQGHSIKLESSATLTPITIDNLPPLVVHGTYYAFWPQIISSGGLKTMNRNHIHCAEGLPGGGNEVKSGMRKDAELLIDIDMEKSLKAGIEWWRSENGVILTEGKDGLLGLEFLKEVRGRKEGGEVGVLWKDGEKVGDLPEGLKVRVPHGKGGRGGNRGGRGGRGGNRGS